MLFNFNQILILLGILIIWLISLTVLFYRFYYSLKKITEGVSKKDLKTILEKILKDLEKLAKKNDFLQKIIDELKKDNQYNIQKVGLVRYNPFAETGGDQSFCLSLLDGKDSGLVISSLHSRDITRIYAKPVKEGKAAGYDLSIEEKQAIKGAKKIK